MERYIDELDVPPRYEGIVEEYRNGDLGNFVGSYCGHPVFSGSQEIIHPTSGEVVGYSNDVQVGRQKYVSQMLYSEFMYMYGGDIAFGELLERGDALLKKERRRRNAPLNMGWTGIKAAAASGAAGGLLEWFDYPPETSLTGAAVGVAVGGLSLVHQRWKRKEKVRSYIEEFSDALSNMEKIAISTNLLAPDSFVDSDAQTGSADNKQASSTYSIGRVQVDQQQRFNSFWDQADEVLEEYGFAEWQGYKTTGMPELIGRILDDIHDNRCFYDDYKEKVGSAIIDFIRYRSSTIRDLEKCQEKCKTIDEARGLRHKYNVGESDLADSDKLVIDQIKQTDQGCAEAFRKLIAKIKEVDTEARETFARGLLARTYGNGKKSSLQGYFWGELSRALVANGIDPYDKSVAEPAQFIADIPGMTPSGSGSPSKSVVYKLYKAVYRNYSGRYDGMLPPEEFIDKLSEDGMWSMLRRYRSGRQY